MEIEYFFQFDFGIPPAELDTILAAAEIPEEWRDHSPKWGCATNFYNRSQPQTLLQTMKYMKNSNPESLKACCDFTQSQLTSTKEITWTVRNLNSASVMKFDPSCSLDSPPFVFQDATWCLRLYPNSRSKKGVAVIGLNIVRLSSHVPHHKLQYFFIPWGNKRGVCYQVADFDEDNRESGEREFIFRYEGCPSVPKNMIKVTCQVSCYESHALNVVSSAEPLKQDTRDLGDLCQDFKKILLNGQNHDIVLKVKGEQFRAHQDILRVRSPVLKSMLDHDMTEKTKGVVDISDCDPGAFRQFLLYLYSGEVEALDEGNMPAVYYIADKYDMGHLKEVCREFAKRSLTCANVSNVIQLALVHSDTLLLEHATMFFVKEMRSILPTVEWQSFVKRNPTQANELFIKATENLYAGNK